MQLEFIGSGDAFGSGGRFHTCFHVTGDAVNFLIDCGASSLIALNARNIKINRIQAIFITHFHADHFGGIPFFMLDAQFFSKREAPLTIAGPKGLRTWFERVMETAFPGSSKTKPGFELSLVELEPGMPLKQNGVNAHPYPVNHGSPGGPYFGYRFEAGNRIISYTGDTAWTDGLIRMAAAADLFIAESYFYDKKVKLHLDYQTLVSRLPFLTPKRLVLTHMSDEMLNRLDTIPHEAAYDGKVITL